ncbi:glycosyltransferase family 2 protein [Geomonas propionica]|uniref:Glycosyltransferase family 2 protein n=1 Tax=Geomonas propionica TaxID=2798582 RepID=A0ABS0YMQ1_9BACT|nr:glycosyltransferase family 2 protein [Geomonas propionica]MBJ6799234.1 glycosyltransferase family 2 protein [Geomonas propionica]
MSASFTLTTPVVLLVFNRPETTARVFAAIRQARPPRLLIVADAARPGRADEAERCAEVRRIVAAVDWPCEVLRDYADVNLGCRRRVASGLDWVFDQVEQAIILEDDCLPDPSFFRFCQELLERYREDRQVGMISGDNFQFGRCFGGDSYYFSRYFHIWGWATWRDRWKDNYDVDLAKWPQAREQGLLAEILEARAERREWTKALESSWRGRIDTWDYQWVFANWVARRLCILPAANLVSNIGFGAMATHTKVAGELADIPSRAISFPLVHPAKTARNREADRASRHRSSRRSLWDALRDFLGGRG